MNLRFQFRVVLLTTVLFCLLCVYFHGRLAMKRLFQMRSSDQNNDLDRRREYFWGIDKK